MLLKLSRVIPVRFRSTYSPIVGAAGSISHLERATWWQWRGRIMRHRRAVV